MSVKLPWNIGDNDWRPIFSSQMATETEFAIFKGR
jgi:hypothetical protein